MAPGTSVVALAAGLLSAGLVRAAPLTKQEEAGRKIFLDGESATGSDITAAFPTDGTMVPGSVLPCASCHGDDGLGRPEGAVIPSDIRWSSLAKPYGSTSGSGRKHPPYDERSLARAIESGRDPAGAPLDPAMPRYSMSRADLTSLIAFLKRLEHLREPGVFPARIRIGTVLPTRGRLRETGEVLRQLLQAWFGELDRTGGIHGRTVELVVAGYDSDREDGMRAARQLLARGDVFALVAPFTPRAEGALARMAEELKLPIVGLLAPTGAQGETANHWVFQVLSGVREQARVLADHAAGLDLGVRSAAILQGEGEALADAAAAARAQLESHGWTQVELQRMGRGRSLTPTATGLRDRGVQVVLFLGGDEELAGFGRAARDLDWAPVLLVPGGLAARATLDLPLAFDGKVFLAFPSGPGNARPEALEHLARLRARGHIPERQLAAQLQACSAAAILAEGLQRTGKAVRRERLVGSLELLYEFETGLVPPVTYGPDRRVGARGGYVVGIDLRRRSFHPAARWSGLP